ARAPEPSPAVVVEREAVVPGALGVRVQPGRAPVLRQSNAVLRLHEEGAVLPDCPADLVAGADRRLPGTVRIPLRTARQVARLREAQHGARIPAVHAHLDER